MKKKSFLIFTAISLLTILLVGQNFLSSAAITDTESDLLRNNPSAVHSANTNEAIQVELPLQKPEDLPAASVHSERAPATAQTTNLAEAEPTPEPVEKDPKDKISLYAESPQVVQERLATDLEQFSELTTVAEVVNVECSESDCNFKLKPKEGRDSKLQWSFLKFLRAHSEYGQFFKFNQTDSDSSGTVFTISKNQL